MKEVTGATGELEILLSAVLHDLRSPLGAIEVLTDLLASRQDALPDSSLRQAHMLREAAIQAERVLMDAIEIQSVLRGRLILNLTTVEIGELFHCALGKAAEARFFKNVEVIAQQGHEDTLVLIDIDKMESVVLSLAETLLSADADSAEPRLLYLSFTRTAQKVHAHLRFACADAHLPSRQPGPDPSRLMRGRLGNRRAGESRYSLSVAEQVAHAMGGTVRCQSTDKETLMTLTLPLAEA